MGSTITQFLNDIFYFPSLGRGIGCVWYRNYIYFRLNLLSSLMWISLEPGLYLLAIGYGLGHFVSDIGGACLQLQPEICVL